ncbi:Uncharacterised protein [BD1-7 clade bacterium]|uniref:Uncharacterized protein n=1 Tax=BD1-7 clade bacterium TaxID=2029982 RepID=A0A5S9PMA3_9GAMM|nr:Uncharacterised protein [BD1-7 clade bacterium]
MQQPGPMIRAHTDLFPIDIADSLLQDARRESFKVRAGQAFDDKDTRETVLSSPSLLALIELWTHLDIDRLFEIQQWYTTHADTLSKNEKRAVIFFGTFSIETLNINICSGTSLKSDVESVWNEHVKLFDAFTRDEVKSFIHRVMLMSEAPLVPDVLGRPDQDASLREQAYIHFRRLYDIGENVEPALAHDALIYADTIVQDQYIRCDQPDQPRRQELQFMFEDIMETFNLSRRFHRKVFGENNIRPDISYR